MALPFGEFTINSKTNYLNNAAFGPIPTRVQKRYAEYLQDYSDNGPDSPFVTKEGHFEEGRLAISRLINCEPDEVIFTQSITHGINIIAEGYHFEKGSKIILRESAKEHVANFLPWLKTSKAKQLELKIMGSDENGYFDLDSLEQEMRTSTGGIVAVAHALYNLGTILKVEDIANLATKYNYRVLVDAAQTLGCYPVDVRKLGCDYMVFSGYKWLCAPPGIGVLYMKRGSQQYVDYYGMDVRILEAKTEGVQVKLQFSDTDYSVKAGPSRFENGFRNYAGVVGLVEAVKFLEEIGIQEIYKRNQELTQLTINLLQEIPGVTILGPKMLKDRTSIVSFTIDGVKPSELVTKLFEARCVLAAREIGDFSIIRISPHYYNSEMQVKECINLIKNFVKA